MSHRHIPLPIRHELWARGETSWKLEDHQHEIFDGVVKSGIHLAYLDITRRGGKSFVLVAIADHYARTRPGTYVKYGAAFQTDLRRYIRPAFTKFLEDCPQKIKPRYIKAESSYFYPNGSVIELVGVDKDPDKLRGNQVTIMILDEAGFIDHLRSVYEDVIIPATARRVDQMQEPLKLLVGSTPPPSAQAHFSYQLREKAKKQGFYIKKTLEDVKSIPQAEKERLYAEVGGKSSNKARREFGVEWITDSDRALMPTFDAAKHVQTFDLPNFYNSIVGGDTAGKRDLNAFHVIAWDPARQKYLVADECWCPTNTPSSVWRQSVLEMESRQPLRPRFRVIDMPEAQRVDTASEGFASVQPDKRPGSKEAMLTFVRDLFYKDQILVHPRCQMLIQTLSSHLLNRSGTDFERNAATGHADAYDSVAYALDYLSKTNPVPPLDPRTTFTSVQPGWAIDEVAASFTNIHSLFD